MANLWLTYAWKDNEAEQVDYIVQALEGAGLNVTFDRAHLIPGQRLWPQIDQAISDPSVSDAWAIYATRNSLSSEPCQEELAYALDRALRTRGQAFPIIGIFPDALDRSLIPSAIATRLWVSLRNPKWVIRSGSRRRRQSAGSQCQRSAVHNSEPWGKRRVGFGDSAARWSMVSVPCRGTSRRTQLHQARSLWPVWTASSSCAVSVGEAQIFHPSGRKYTGVRLDHAVDFFNSAYVYFSKRPTELVFGDLKRRAMHTVTVC